MPQTSPSMGRRAKSLTARPDARGKHLCVYNTVAVKLQHSYKHAENMPPLSQGGKNVQEKTPLLEAEVSFQESLLRAHEMKRCKTGVKQLFKTV